MKNITLIGTTLIMVTAMHAQADIQAVEDKTLRTVSGQAGSIDNLRPIVSSAARKTSQLPVKLVKFYVKSQIASVKKVVRIGGKAVEIIKVDHHRN